MDAEFVGKRVVIAGGSGFLGLSLAEYLSSRNAEVTILSRNKSQTDYRHELWDARTTGKWCDCLEKADVLINLAGRTVNCIKTPDHKDEILRSRVESTRVLGQACRNCETPPSLWIQMSTAHIYGDPPHTVCTEDSETGIGFAPEIGKAWERTFDESKLDSQRGVVLRTSFVIGRDRGAGAGALGMLGFLARVGLGGKVGKGTQGMSWIHELDLNRIIASAIEDSQLSGCLIASAPNPVSQVEFTRILRRAVGMPIGLPATEWMVRLGAPLVFRTDPELALYGRYVTSSRLSDYGFDFQFPDLETALCDLYGRDEPAR